MSKMDAANPRNGVRWSQAVSCASMSATTVASSGSTWGR